MNNPIRNVMDRTRLAVFALGALALTACEQTAGFGPSQIEGVDANKKVTVALMVPLDSGQSELNFLGTSLVNAARLARNDLSGIDLDLRVYPTAGNDARAATAAQQAIDEGAQIIVGPLFSTATAAAAPVAAQNGVSILSFSNNSRIAGNNVFVLGTTFDTIADRIVSYSVAQGKSQIAVVHSNDAGGQTGRAATEAAVQRYGAAYAGASGYDLSPAGISGAAPQIARQLRASGANAVVFTDDPATGLTFLTPVMASAGFSNQDAQYLGLTRWNEPAGAAQTPSLQGGIFAAPDPGPLSRFTERYTATYGSAPHALAGLAYDGIAAVGAMISSAQAGEGQALTRAQITDPNGFAGVNGIFRFGNSGISQRGLALMRIQNGAASVIDPAPRSFGGAGL